MEILFYISIQLFFKLLILFSKMKRLIIKMIYEGSHTKYKTDIPYNN